MILLSKEAVFENINFILSSVCILFLIFLTFIFFKKNFLNKKLFFWIRITGISVIIALIIFYGYLLIKYTVSTYISSVLFIFICCVLIGGMMKYGFKVFSIKERLSKIIKLLLLIFVLLWLSCENYLRFSHVNETYNEKTTNYYASGYKNLITKDKKNPHLWIHSRYESSLPERSEFSYKIECNAEGLRDTDHPIEKDSNEYRIICLGNSFTEGIGTPQDSTWPKLLENKLNSDNGKKISVFNAGISGSDSFFEYMLLEERLVKYEPDLVLLTLGESDFDFYSLRGGFERFDADGFHFRQGPVWEKLYAVSYIFRFYVNNILNYKNLISPDAYKADKIKAEKDIENCIYKFDKLAEKEHFKLVVVFIETNSNTENSNSYLNLIKKVKNKNIIPVIDLFEYNNNIEKMTAEKRKNYFWPVDRHYNAKGYDLFSKGVEWNLNTLGIIDSIIN